MTNIGIKGRSIDLYVRFTDAAENPVNTDATPTAAVYDSVNTLLRAASTSGVGLYEDPGIYRLSYEIPLTAADSYGVINWAAEIGGEAVSASFEFQIIDGGQIASIAKPEYTPGDDYIFEFSPAEITGINRLLKIVKARLKSDGVRKIPDGQGGHTTSVCNVFSNDELIAFLIGSLSEFNAYPHTTGFTFADDVISGLYLGIISQGAVLLGLAAQALIEKGREYSIIDNGVQFTAPQISEILAAQYNSQLADYKEKLKMIKCSIKPGPKSVGSYTLSTFNPAIARLRHLRARRLV